MKVGSYEIEIPEDWILQKSESITSIFTPNGFGVVQISSFLLPNDYDLNLFDELYDFASEYVTALKQYKKLKKINYGLLLDEIIENNRTWLFAILNKKHSILLVTYNSLGVDFHKEHCTALAIINSITFL